jgi:hypothetical protein
MYKIDWIPAGDGWDDETNFKKLCDHHGIKLDWNTSVVNPVYKTMVDHIKIKLRVMLRDELGEGSRQLWSMLAKDIDLYEKVQENFDTEAVSWPDVSWKSSQRGQ